MTRSNYMNEGDDICEMAAGLEDIAQALIEDPTAYAQLDLATARAVAQRLKDVGGRYLSLFDVALRITEDARRWAAESDRMAAAIRDHKYATGHGAARDEHDVTLYRVLTEESVSLLTDDQQQSVQARRGSPSW